MIKLNNKYFINSYKLSLEEKVLIKILLKNNFKDSIDVSKIDLDNLIKITSSHLMLPSLYSNIINKRLSKLFPTAFINYIEEIYKLNKQRNIQLVEEINFLSKILNEKEINHVFLKGSANITYSIYQEIGERMIGDIDLLVDKKQLSLVKDLLEKENYYPSEKTNFFEINEKHIKRRVNKKKIFAVEVHTKLTNNAKIIDENRMLKNKIKIDNVLLPSPKSMIKHTIYNWQINDNGYSQFRYSYRCIYDYIMLTKKYRIDVYENTKQYRDFLITMSLLGVKESEINESYYRKIIRKQIKSSKRKRYLYYQIMCAKENVKRIPEKILMILQNPNYLRYLFKKHL